METLEQFRISNTNQKITISFDSSIAKMDYFIQFLKRYETEFLAQKANFSIEIVDLAEDIDQQWWNNNGAKFLNGIAV